MPGRGRVQDPKDPKVRPRQVWIGMGLAILALATAGVALMVGRHWLAGIAGGVTVLGLLVAWHGGVHYDTRGQEPPHSEVQEFVRGGVHEGVSPSAHAVGPEMERKAAALEEQRRAAQARTMARTVGLRPLAAIGILAVGAWLVVGQGFLGYPFTVSGQDSALRDVGFAIVLVLAALRLRLPRRSLVASGLCAVAGLLLVLSAFLLPHDSPTVRGNELLSGALVLGFMALTVIRPGGARSDVASPDGVSPA